MRRQIGQGVVFFAIILKILVLISIWVGIAVGIWWPLLQAKVLRMGFAAYAFIVVGSAVAPKHKTQSGLILLVLLVLVLGGYGALVAMVTLSPENTLSNSEIAASVISIAVGIGAAIAGFQKVQEEYN